MSLIDEIFGSLERLFDIAIQQLHHDFVDDAIKRGAVAVVAEKQMNTSVPLLVVDDPALALARVACFFYQNPSAALPVMR